MEKIQSVTKKNLAEVTELLKRASEAYYEEDHVSGARVMTDGDFDDLKQSWEEFTGKKWQTGSAPKNVSSTVTMSHGYENVMGTLDKVNSTGELEEWMEKRDITPDAPIRCGMSLKYDGHALLFEFKANMLQKAMTRGQDGVGKDLTRYFQKARDGAYNVLIIDRNSMGLDFAVSFEAVISWECLDQLNEEFGTTYKNPRSAIGGIIKDDGIEMAKYLTLIPLKFRVKDRPEGNMTRDDELQVLDMIVASQKSELFDKMEYSEFSNVSEIEDAYAEIAKGRLDMKYMIDGLVIEALEEEVRDALGYADDRPRFAVALKFPYIEKETEAVSLSWYTEGNTAIYTPVVNFKPVVLNGNTYQNTSIANYARFKELQLRKGDRVTFQLRNEVLGWIDKLETVGNENPLFKAPVKCEYCEAKLETDGVFLFCDNQECALVKLGNLQQFIDKLKIKGVQRATIEALVAAGLLENIPDFITLDYDAVANLEGFGIASARKLRDAIDGKLMIEGLKDWELLGSLNIPLVSTSRAKEILKHVSLQEMCIGPAESWKPRVMAIHGIKGKVANALAAGITKRHDTLTKMMSLVEGSSTKVKEVGAVEGPVYRVCITGALKRYKDRDDFKTAIEDKGHKCVSGVTKKTDFLVTNDTGSGTVKNQEAARLGIPILTEDQAIEKFGINKRPGKQVALKDVM